MYAAFTILCLIVAAGLIAWGIQEKPNTKIILGSLIAGGVFLFFSVLSFRSDALWFDSLGGSEMLRKMVVYRVLFAILGGAIGFAILWFLTLFVFAHRKSRYRWIPIIIGFYFGAKWGGLNWGTIFLYLNRANAGIEDPALYKDTGFYLFTLPFYNQLYLLLFGLCVIGLLSVFAASFLSYQDEHLHFKRPALLMNSKNPARPIRWIRVNIVSLLFVLTWGQHLNRFHLLYSHDGVVYGAGLSNAGIHLPALLIVIAALSAGAMLLLIPGLRKWIKLSSIGGYSIP